VSPSHDPLEDAGAKLLSRDKGDTLSCENAVIKSELRVEVLTPGVSGHDYVSRMLLSSPGDRAP
jgi:hypothetical protein